MENRIKKIMSEVLNIEIDSINNNTSPKTVEAWDSLKQMNLIVALEEEFDIEFDDDKITVSSYYELYSIIQNEGK